MAYDLRAFNRTWVDTSKGSRNNSVILAKWPYLCSREALIIALENVADGTVTQRNPQGYTAAEMADIIIDRFDQIMYDTWDNSTVYHPLAFENARSAGYRWDQPQFWGTSHTHFIFHDGGGAGRGNIIRGQNIDDPVLLPSYYHIVNSAEFYKKPYLGFDKRMRVSDFGLELDMSGDRPTGIDADGTWADDQAGDTIPYDEIHKSLLYIYDASYYHATFQPNGFDSSQYYSPNPADWQQNPSSKRYDLSTAKFEATVSGGKVTAVTPVSRLDGDGNPVTGGWGYNSSNNYNAIRFETINVTTATQKEPRLLYVANTDQPGYTNNKATTDITVAANEFYAGEGLTDGTYDAYAGYSAYGGYRGEAIDPGVSGSFDNWYDVNLPIDVEPSSVRVMSERPVLKSTTRSLKQITVGTGAQRYGFEFEYPPMTQSEVDKYIDFFENAKGGSKPCQIYIPHVAMPHVENLLYDVDVNVASNNLDIISGKTVGSQELTLKGLEPARSYAMVGRHFVHDNKIYRIIGSSSTPDNFGRMAIRIEPPLVSAGSNSIRGRTTSDTRGNYFLVKAFLTDDTLDYSVDAAGLYRIRFKFVEAME
jgi:hypothetical protein